MEIKITLVRFTVAKKQIEKKSNDALCFEVNNEKIWIPFKKLNTYPMDNDGFLEVVMPRWLFLKTNLPSYFKTEEFDYTTEY